MKKVLKGQSLHESDYADIQMQLEQLFYSIIFKPMVDLLAPKNAQMKAASREFKNSTELRNTKFDPIVSGINSGKIQYVQNAFSGDFNASISKALKEYGAKYNKRTKTFIILPQQLPVEVLEASKVYDLTAQTLHDMLLKKLDEIQDGLSDTMKENPIDAKKTVAKMDKKFNREYGDAVGTEDLSEASKQRLDKAYAANIEPYIKKFSDEMILEIRGIVEENSRTGYRFSNLVDKIQGRYDVTKSKAVFLARQETGLFVSKARQTRFEEVGVTKYVWQTAGDTEVRKDHKKLNGRTFEYAHPPIVDAATGRRANPGTDFNCRCVDSPVLELEPVSV